MYISSFCLSKSKVYERGICEMTVTILITGHRGYIGSALFRTLSELNVIDRIVGYDLVDGDDILNYERLLSTMMKSRPDIVIHLAALSSVTACNDDPKLAIKINGQGTLNVLNAMKEVGCEHIIYASTSSVYGDSKELPYNENSAIKPCSPYGVTKLLGEHAIFNHYIVKGNVGNYLIFRMFNVVGSSGYSDIDAITSSGYDRLFGALQSGLVNIYGNNYPTFDGTCERDYVALKDVCDAYIKGIIVIGCKCKVREVINISTEEPVSVKWIIEVWNNISERIRNRPRIEYNPLPYVRCSYGPRRAGDPPKVCGSNKKAKTTLEWTPKRKIEDVIYDLAHDKKL